MKRQSYFSNKKKIDSKRPPAFKALISKEAYKKIIDLAIKHAENIGTIQSIHEGVMIIADKVTKTERTIELNNIVRRCKATEGKHWDKILYYHFQQLIVNPAKLNFFYKDFEFAEPYLKIFVLPAYDRDNLNDLVYRTDLPNTHTFLILDYDEKFHYVNQQKSVAWGKTTTELFDIAQANIALEKIEIDQFIWKDKFEVFSLFNGDFSAAFILDLAKNATYAIGKYGAIVSMPTKGAVFLHPLQSNTVVDFIQSFKEVVDSFYREDEEPIIRDFYWFYEGVFNIISMNRGNEKEYQIAIPLQLKTLFQ